MSFYLQKSGQQFFADMLAGSPLRINGMYVEATKTESPTAPCTRDSSYFEALKKDKETNYARVALTNAYTDKDLIVHFDAMVREEDFVKKYKRNTTLACATLVCMKDNDPAHDIFICTTNFDKPIAVSNSTYTVINTSIKLGA